MTAMPSPSPSPPPPPPQPAHPVLLAAAGPPASIIRLKNIQSTIRGPHDAWGRPDRPQPISVSVTVHLVRTFYGPASAARDALTQDTIHYGLLGKAILSAVEGLRGAEPAPSLADVLSGIWVPLTGVPLFADARGGGHGAGVVVDAPFLRLASTESLELTVCLPKASLHGAGVSLTGRGVFADGSMRARSVALELHRVRLPVLLGVNENERAARQGVVANMVVERLEARRDCYCEVEGVLVQAMSTSSFETIEALVSDLAARIKGYLVERHTAPEDGQGWHLRIAVEKPIAVVFADAPCVELRIGTNQVSG